MTAVQIARLKKCRTVSLTEGFKVDPLSGAVRPVLPNPVALSTARWLRGPIESGADLGMAVMRVLGIETRHAMAVTVEMQAGEVATVAVKRLVPTGAMKDIAESFEKYEIRLKAEPASSAPLSS